MLKSIGDFAINIIPKVEKASIGAVSSFLGNLGADLVGKGIGKVSSFLQDATTDTMTLAIEMKNLSVEMGLPISKLQEMTRIFGLAGLSADQAFSAVKQFAELRVGNIFGQGWTPERAVFGLTPTMFGKDPVKNIERIRNAVKGTAPDLIAAKLGAAGFSAEMVRVIGLKEKDYQNFKRIAGSVPYMSESLTGEAKTYDIKRQQLGWQKQNVFNKVTEAVAPQMIQLLETFSTILKDPGVMKGIEALISGLIKLTSAISNAGAAIVKLIGNKETISSEKTKILDEQNDKLVLASQAFRNTITGTSQGKATTVNNKVIIYATDTKEGAKEAVPILINNNYNNKVGM